MHKILSIGIFILISINLLGQKSTTIKFNKLTIKDGLSQSTINCVTQDSLGFIWIGTQDGLNRYDGYGFKVFKQNAHARTGLKDSYINCLMQDFEDNLWVGTQSGGISKISLTNSKLTHFNDFSELENANIRDLKIDVDSTIWIATAKQGVFHYLPRENQLKSYSALDGLTTSKINTLVVTSSSVFVGTDGAGLNIINKSTEEVSYINSGNTIMDDNTIRIIKKQDKEHLFIGTNNGLYLLTIEGNEVRRIDKNIIEISNDFSVISSVQQLPNGDIFYGTQGNGLYKVIVRDNDTSYVNYHYNDYDPTAISSNIVNEIFLDQTGTVWVGTQDGLSFFDPVKQGFEHYNFVNGEKNSLLDKTVWAIFEKNNVIWVGNRKGITRINKKDNKYYHYPYRSDNPMDPNNHSVYAIKVDDKNRVWVGATGGLYQLITSPDYKTAEYKKVPFKDEGVDDADSRVFTLYNENDSVLWIGGREGIGELNLKTLKTKYFSANLGYNMPKKECRAIFVDRQLNLWLGYTGGGLVKVKRTRDNSSEKYTFKRFVNNPNDTNSLSNNTVLSIYQDFQDRIWVGTYGGGLNLFIKGNQTFKCFTEESGLANNSIYGVLEADTGVLWISTNYGLSKFYIGKDIFENYHESDGLQSNEFNTGAYFKGDNGKLYFGGINGFNAFYPSDIKSNPIPPKVVINNILISNKPIREEIDSLPDVPFLKQVYLNYRQNNLTFKFSALHYTYPKGNKYKVFMKGVDESPTYLEDLQQINYSNLSTGKYTFEVWAANSDGQWGETPATLELIITPPFWKTWWFITIASIFLVGIVLLSYVLRVQAIKSQKRKLAFLVEKRTKMVTRQKEQIEKQKKALEVEKEKADKLLSNILPSETAEELKNKGKAKTRKYRMVTVMFSDIVGFTKIAEKMEPTVLVKKLDHLFKEMDKITEKNQVEKIKTIGDAYMAAAGVPLRDKENPIHAVLAALEIQDYMTKLKEKAEEEGRDDYWQLRIGIHTGDVIAGVIGSKRIAYDIWGNTVNVANRMETASEPCKVNISGTTYDSIAPYFDCTYRGKIPTKNKGEMDMYFVDQIKPHLSRGGLGITPNKKFYDYINLHIYSNINYKKAERHIMKILTDRLSPNLHYHGIHHTYDVVEAVERLAIMEGVLDEDIFVLKSAATYHDAGFVEQYEANEPIGARMAEEILPLYGYTEDQVEEVKKLIYATIIPHNPNSKLEEIICDADLDYLGRDDFHQIADTLRRELRDHGKINSDRLWDEIQVKFLTQHKYFTKSAKKLREAKKAKHLEEIKKRLEEDNYKD